MVIEGPITTTIAAFAASVGIFNIYLIFILSLLGDVTGDVIHYYFGFILRRTVIERYIKKHGIKKSAIKKLESKIHNNFFKSMMVIKITPPLATPGLLLVGASKVPFSKYLFGSLITTMPLTIFYTTLGYYFGFAIKQVLDYFKMGQYILFFILLLLVLIYFVYKFIYRKIAKRLNSS